MLLSLWFPLATPVGVALVGVTILGARSAMRHRVGSALSMHHAAAASNPAVVILLGHWLAKKHGEG